MPEPSTETQASRRGTLTAAVQNSRFSDGYEWLQEQTRALASRGRSLVTASFLYRWLTKEPEPEVIVIDLRETWTVGPVIGVLDAAIEKASPYWQASTVKTVVDRTVASLERAAETRVGEAIAAVLAPPDPPERATGPAASREDEGGGVDEADAAPRDADDTGGVDADAEGNATHEDESNQRS